MFSTVVRRENWLSDKLSFATGQDFLLLQVQGNVETNHHQHSFFLGFPIQAVAVWKACWNLQKKSDWLYCQQGGREIRFKKYMDSINMESRK